MPEPVSTLRLTHRATFFGPNPLSINPVIVASISSSAGSLSSSDAWMQACLVLRELFPDWVDPPDPSAQHPLLLVGRTAARWALAALNEIDGLLRDAGAVPVGIGARVWLGFHDPDVSLSALKSALAIMVDAARWHQLDRSRVDSVLEALWQLCRKRHPNHNAPIMMRGAHALDIPVLPFIAGSRLWQYGWGGRSRMLLETSSNANGHLGGLLANSKVLSKMLLADLGIPTPEHRLVTRVTELPEAVEAVGWPCVVKPISQRGGKGVTAGISTLSEAEAAFAIARRYSHEAIMVEAFVPGHDHRLMVVEGGFFAAIRREASSLTGDGRSTVAELIAALNSGRSINRVKSRYLDPIVVDDVVEQHLERQGVSVCTVLEGGRRIALRGNGNLSTGGVCFDVTGEVHPHTRQMAETTARTIGLAVAGFDFITTDIGKPWHECGAMIEFNASPGADVLVAAGLEPVSFVPNILGSKSGRILIRLVVTPRSELAHVLDHLRSIPPADGFGWASEREAAIAGMPLRIRGAGPWPAIETLLRHASVQQACLLCPAETIVRHGMPVDKVDSTALYRCSNPPLPAVWMKVLANHGGIIRRCSDWGDLKLTLFTTTGLSSG